MFSPARALPKLDQDGWFLAQQYLTVPAYRRVEGEACGRVDARVVEELYSILEGHYWEEA